MEPAEKFSGVDTAKSTAKFVRLLDAGVISAEECFTNILSIAVLTERSDWAECISAIPGPLRSAFAKFARSHLTSVDYMPHPGVVRPSANTPDVIEAAKHYYRPIYMDLLRVVEESRPVP